MSLVELLVVVAILGLLAVTVLPTIASTTESRRTREAARVTSSFITSAQTRALGRREWSGFRLVPTGTGNVALDLTLVEVPPSYRGDMVGAQISIPTPGTGLTLTGTAATGVTLTQAQTLGLGPGGLIRFAERDTWYLISSINYAAGTIEFERRAAVGQSFTNTVWPPAGNQLFEIALAPVALGSPVTLVDGRVIDLTWSGYVAPGTGAYVHFAAGDVTVLYDGTGRLRRVVHVGATTDAPGTVFFLVGRADRAGNASVIPLGSPQDDSVGANWQYSDSVWIMINPAAGTVHQAACDPAASGVEASQSFVRAYLSAGGGS